MNTIKGDSKMKISSSLIRHKADMTPRTRNTMTMVLKASAVTVR